MKVKLGFHGAAGNVTGSCYLLQANGMNILIDCGMYQEHDLKDRNWDKFPLTPMKIDAVVLTHAHLDHCGRLPRLVKAGFDGPVYCTGATAEIARIVMADCGRINEEDAEFKRLRHLREGRQGPHPVEPLYTEEDAEEVTRHFEAWDYTKPLDIGPGITAEFIEVGHILGASAVRITVTQGDETLRILFSGDVGRWDMPILRDPAPLGKADYVVIESTYGNREHQATASIPEQLESIIHRVKEEGGNLVIPSFAVERTQDLLYFLALLSAEDRIPHLPIYVDSPMASRVNTVFMHHPYLFDADTMKLARTLRLSNVNIVRSMAESKMVNHIKGTAIIIAGSGMCTGGRIKHHLVHNISRPECTILFVGYQASQTLGRLILDGEPEVRILGEICPVKAHIERIDGFSAHADRNELLRWLGTLETTPKHVFVTHGEPDAAASLRDLIAEQKGFEASVPEYLQTVELG